MATSVRVVRELTRPRYYKMKLMVDNATAQRLSRLGGVQTEAALRDAVDRTFCGAFSSAQGVVGRDRNLRLLPSIAVR